MPTPLEPRLQRCWRRLRLGKAVGAGASQQRRRWKAPATRAGGEPRRAAGPTLPKGTLAGPQLCVGMGLGTPPRLYTLPPGGDNASKVQNNGVGWCHREEGAKQLVGMGMGGA